MKEIQATVSDATGTRSFVYNSALQLEKEELAPAFYGNRVLKMLYQDGSETSGLPGRPAGFQVGVTANPDRDYATVWEYAANGRWGINSGHP